MNQTPAQQYATAVALADDFNRRVVIGDKIRYWHTARDIGTGFGFVEVRTISEARVADAKTATVLIAPRQSLPIAHCKPVKEIRDAQLPRCPKCNSRKQKASGDRAWFCVECGCSWEPNEERFDPTITGNPSRRMERQEERKQSTNYRGRS